MDKRPDFGKDLAALSDNVTAEVGDVLQALRQKKRSSGPPIVSNGEHMTEQQQPISLETASVDPSVDSTESTTPSTPRRPRPALRSRLKPVVERDTVLENVTTRLHRATNELLTEAALRQRLKKESPATRQDIVEAALQDWFRKQGYAAGRDSGDD